MTVSEERTVTEVVRSIQSWPAAMRIALARRVLETLDNGCASEAPSAQTPGPSAAEVAAMFQTNKPAPDDQECQRILEEELLRKYGQ